MAEYIAISRSHSTSEFPPDPLTIIPMRWVLHANKLGVVRGAEYPRRKLRTGNVGRKLRRFIRRSKTRGTNEAKT